MINILNINVKMNMEYDLSNTIYIYNKHHKNNYKLDKITFIFLKLEEIGTFDILLQELIRS